MANRAGTFALLLLTLSGPALRAETPRHSTTPDAGAEKAQTLLRTVTLQQYKDQLTHARQVAASCREEVSACVPAAVGSDDRVADAGFDVHWAWLRNALTVARGARPQDRSKLLTEVSSRLDTEARDAGLEPSPSPGTAVDFTRARAAADQVLAHGEFRQVTEEALTERALARIARWLDQLFSGVSSLGRLAPWLGSALEWGFVVLAAAFALAWVQRVLRRQKLAIAQQADAPVRDWDAASRQWADAAREAAAQGDWREAVHSLYWASVVELEGRRVWRQSRGRTPREYLRLLEARSPYYPPVRALTQSLERIWYGLAAANRGDYERAFALYETLRSA